jgi:hypothetical protein
MIQTLPGVKDVKNIASSAYEEHQERMARYTRLSRLYYNQISVPREIGEPAVRLNYARKFVEKHVAFLMKGGFSVKIPDDPFTPEQNETEQLAFVGHMAERIWKMNRKHTLGLEMAQMGSVTGDVFLRLSIMPAESTANPYGVAYPRIDVLPSQFVFPEFGGPIGVDKREVTSVLVVFPVFKNGSMRDAPIGPSVDWATTEYYAERWYRDRVVRYNSSGVESTSENDLGFIPIVHIANFPLLADFYGESDIEDILSPARETNQQYTNMSDILSYHAAPTTIISGAKVGQLERGANRLWTIPESAKAYNLEMNNDMKANVAYLSELRVSLHELASIPEGILGGMEATDSAVAMALKYQPILDRRTLKVAQYSQGIVEVTRRVLFMQSLIDSEFYGQVADLDPYRRFLVEVHFPDPLPRDESIELDKSAKRLGLGLTSRKYELTHRYGMSPADADNLVNEAREERRMDAELEFEIGAEFDPVSEAYGEQSRRSGNPDPTRPNPEAAGAVRSARAQVEGRGD